MIIGNLRVRISKEILLAGNKLYPFNHELCIYSMLLSTSTEQRDETLSSSSIASNTAYINPKFSVIKTYIYGIKT